MKNPDQSIDYTVLSSELKTLFNETIGSALHSGIQTYLDFSDHFIKSSQSFETKCQKTISDNSLQGFLYENIRYCDNITTHFEDYIKESPDSEIIQLLENLINNSYQLLSCVPEDPEISDQIEKLFSTTKQKKTFKEWASNNFSHLKDKIKSKKEFNQEEKDSIRLYKFYPNRNFFFHFLISDNINNQLENFGTLFSDIIKLLSYLWSIEKKSLAYFDTLTSKNYNFQEVDFSLSEIIDIDKVNSFKSEILKTTDILIQGLLSQIDKFLVDFEQGLKIEMSEPLGTINIKRESEKLVHNYVSTRNNWNNTVFLLSEDWKLKLEINSLKFYTLKEYFDFSNIIETKFSGPGKENLEFMASYVADFKKEIENIDKSNPVDFSKNINAAKIGLKRQLLLKSIPALKEIVVKADIPRSIDDVESNSINKFDLISKKRYLIKNPTFDQPIDRSDFESISPHALVAHEMLPGFKNVFPELKTTFIRHVQSFENRIAEIPEIIDFTIESTVSYLETEKNITEALKICLEGLSREEKKLEELITLHNTFIEGELEKLKKSIELFISQINDITDSESALQIKLRVAKSKAIEKSRIFRKKILEQIRNFLPIILDYINKGFAFLRLSSERIRKQFGTEELQDFISSDTSDYLAETEDSISRLPFIYQRLFKIEPLTSFELYIEREEPMKELIQAYKNWKKSKFAPVVIIGEKGSGKTTFINRFIKSNTKNQNVIFLNLHENKKSPQSIYNHLLDITTTKQESENKDKNKEKKIIVVDGLECLFSTEINGFEYLMKTMQLISETNFNVFWIFTVHLYSWKYIDKSCGVSDYFGYHIKLTELMPDDLLSIIEKRHNISGFNLVFEPNQTKKVIVNLKKIKEEDKQNESRVNYFNELKDFNNGNISQAFLYWLRSTSNVKDDTIYIRSINQVNQNFVASISQDKLLTLRYILIHNGLNSEEHARIFRKNQDNSRLHLDQMLDDGLIVKTDDDYLINPLIYSQVVAGLTKINLLH